MQLAYLRITMRSFLSVCCLLLAVVACGCKGVEISAMNVRVVPSYICEGDGQLPTAVWDLPQGNDDHEVRVYGYLDYLVGNWNTPLATGSAGDQTLTFASAPERVDLPLVVTVWDGDDRAASEVVQYRVIGPDPKWTEDFIGEPEWGEPFTQTVEIKGFDENNQPTTEYVDLEFQRLTRVVWRLPGEWFSSNVMTRSVVYEGNWAVAIVGPGLDGEPQFDGWDTRDGNNEHPGGVWVATPAPDDPNAIREAGDSTYDPPARLRLLIACDE